MSTSDQSLARQRRQTSEYATNQLRIEPTMIDVYSDKQTGTNTDRDGYSKMMEAVENGEVDRAVTSEMSRLSRSVRDFADAVDRIADTNKVALHVLDMGIKLDPKNPEVTSRKLVNNLGDSENSRAQLLDQ